MFDGLKAMGQARLDALRDPQNSDLKRPMNTLRQAENAGVDTKEGRRLLEQARDEFEDKNYHDLAEGVQNVLRSKPSLVNERAKGIATDYVREQFAMFIEEDEENLQNDEKGLENLASAARSDESSAAFAQEMMGNAPEGEYTSKEIRAAARKVEAKADLAESMQDTQADVKEAREALKSSRAKAEKETDPKRVGAVLSQGIRRAIGILDVRYGKLKNESDAARANDVAGRGGGTGTQYGLALSALKDRISSLRVLDADSRTFAGQVESFMEDGMFAEIMEDES